jgi:hypothetical protein
LRKEASFYACRYHRLTPAGSKPLFRPLLIVQSVALSREVTGFSDTGPLVPQTAPDGKHYLLAAWAAAIGNTNPTSSQVLEVVAQLDAPTLAAGSENASASGAVLAYPSSAADHNLNIYLCAANFSTTNGPNVMWILDNVTPLNTIATSFNFTNLSSGILQASTAPYVGENSCGVGDQFLRWGDYMSTMWDPNVIDPNGKKGAFWTVQESTDGTNGGTQQNTQWIELGNPFPQLAAVNDGGVNCTPGTTCSVTVKAPAKAQAGDVFVVSLDEGQDATGTLPTVPSGWNIMYDQNLNQALLSSDSCGFKDTAWLLTYAYPGPGGDSGSYTFKHPAKSYGICDSITVVPNMRAFLVDYRGANGNLSSTAYCVQSYPGSSDTSSFSTGSSALPSPYVSQILTTFVPVEDLGTVATPTGAPPVTVEALGGGILEADVPADAPNLNFGPYSTTVSPACTGPACIWYAWQVPIALP